MTIREIASLNFSSVVKLENIAISRTSQELLFPEIGTSVVGDEFCSQAPKDYKTEEQLREDFAKGIYKDGQTGKVGDNIYVIKNNGCWIYKSNEEKKEQIIDKKAINYDSLEKLQLDFEYGKYVDGQSGKVGNQEYVIKNNVCTVYTKK